MSVGDSVGAVSATDALSYSILAGNSAGKFAIVTATGSNTIAGSLDHEATSAYALTVRAEDSRGDTVDATVNIVVTDVNEWPEFSTQSYRFSLPEDAAIGTTVCTVSATDPEGASVSYSIFTGSTGKFAIDPDSGVVTIESSLDLETIETYALRVRAQDPPESGGRRTAYADVQISVTSPVDLAGEWSVLDFKSVLLDGLIPASERGAGNEYHLDVPTDTGFQVWNEASGFKSCNWKAPPPTNTPWSAPGARFYLVRCNLGTGTADIALWKKSDSGASDSSKIATWEDIKQSWHRNDHQVGYIVHDFFMDGDRPGHVPQEDEPDATTSTTAIDNAASAWNGEQTHVMFEAVSSSNADTTFRGYWNPGTANDKCGGSIACVFGGGTYPDLGYQEFWVEYPPSFPSDTLARDWTTNANTASNRPHEFSYLPQVLMHEFGHLAGLGHSDGDSFLMGYPNPSDPHPTPPPYDVNGIKYIYRGHTRDHD